MLKPTVGFRFRAYIDQQTLRALKAQLRWRVRFTTPCVGQIYFYQRDGKGLTLTELRQLALDLRKQDVQLVGKSSRRMRLRDVAFQELKTVLKYQVEKYGKELVLVEPAYFQGLCQVRTREGLDLSRSRVLLRLGNRP